MDGGDQENDGELLAESEEIPYECGPRQKYSILFYEPIPLQANRWYVAWAKVSGPSSDCGSGGQGMVTAEDQLVNRNFSIRSNVNSFLTMHHNYHLLVLPELCFILNLRKDLIMEPM